MTYIPIDLTNVQQAGEFPVYPAGVYTLRVKEVRQETAKSSGEPKLTVIFNIENGPDGANTHNGGTVVRSYSLQQKALPFLKRALNAMGVTEESIAAAGGYLSTEMLEGKYLQARLAIRIWNGRETNDVNELTGSDLAASNVGNTATGNVPTGTQGFTPPPAQPPGFPAVQQTAAGPTTQQAPAPWPGGPTTPQTGTAGGNGPGTTSGFPAPTPPPGRRTS